MSVKRIAKNTLLSIVVFVQMAAFPTLALAQEAAPDSTAPAATSESTSDSSTVTPPKEESPAPATTKTETSTQGPTQPTGADSKTYTKNADGTWSNSQYTWDPNTKQTKPNTAPEYSYNPSTGRWDTVQWVYHPETGRYEPNVVSVAANPGSSLRATTASPGFSAPLSIDTTGPNSNNSINIGTATNGMFDLFFNGSISNNLSSSAISGDSLVQGNTKAGSALTGDAAALENVLNMLQSSWLGQSSDLATFVTNVDGSVFGDLLIDPSALAYKLGTNNTNVDVKLSNNGVINNNIDLTAQSGDATVSGNTSAGDAATGNARAMANVINMINSAIKSGKSFLGMVNINGSLNGDILLPPGVLDALIANTGPNSSNSIGGNSNSNVNVNSNTNRTINNDVNTSAATGNADVSGNTSAGNAQTGQANTSVKSMNLIGQNITGKNGLLVFVNVLGKWVGMVVSPSGANITNTGPDSTNTIGGNSNSNVSVNANENSLINNKINANAASGDASVTHNTSAGNATTGDADVSVNLLNMIGSSVDVTDWFGVLFINVFGDWAGNFGSDTANGGFSQSPQTSTTGSTTTNATTNNTSGNGGGNVFGFIARTFSQTPAGGNDQQASITDTGAGSNNQVVFGATSPSDPSAGSGESKGTSSVSTTASLNTWAIAGILGVIATAIVLIREYVMALREERLA
jgi:hypothetical protein